MLGHTEIIIIAGIVLVLFGSTAIPKFFRAIGKARNEFDKGVKEGDEGEKIDELQKADAASKK